MKNVSIIKLIPLFILFSSVSLFAQLLNSSFEHWDILGNPVGWHTTNIPSLENAIVQSSDAQDGVSSVKIEVMNFQGLPYSGNLQSLDSTNSTGHLITERYSNLSGYHKFSPNGSAHLLIIVTVYDETFMPIGVGGIDEFDHVNSWSQFNIPIEYFFNSEAASIVVSVSIVDTATSGFDINTVGSTAFIDNLTLGNPTDIAANINIPANFSLSQNYPNPFNPSTTIKYSIPYSVTHSGVEESLVSLKLYDILGRDVATLVNETQKPGYYEIEFNPMELTNGVYLYQLITKNFAETKKMILLK